MTTPAYYEVPEPAWLFPEAAERVTLTNRGRKQAVIVPCTDQSRPSAATHAAFGMWKDRDDFSDVAGHVRQLRKGRSF